MSRLAYLLFCFNTRFFNTIWINDDGTWVLWFFIHYGCMTVVFMMTLNTYFLSKNRNLEIIGGRDKADYFSSLYIVKTSLHALHLRSLKKIRSGAVTILENEKLCYAHQINWSKIKSEKADVQIYNNKPATDCEKTGEVCSSQCSKDGCWGLEPRDCLACAKFKLDDNCVPSCNSTIGYAIY